MLWLYRALEMRYGGDSILISQMRDFVADTLLTTSLNGTNEFSFQDVQGIASTYLADTRFHCTSLRNFFLSVIMDHLVKLNTPTKTIWKWYGLAAVFALLFVIPRSIAWTIAPIIALPWLFVLGSLVRSALAEPTMTQVSEEIRRGTFEEITTADRLKRLEKMRIKVPSIMYALLRQPKLNVETDMQCEWNKLSQDQRSAIFGRQSAWLKEMYQYSKSGSEA
jgi:hypothetical protein